MLSIGVIGYGYWGPNLVRNFQECGVAKVTMVSDLNESRLKLAKTRYPSIKTTLDHLELIRSSEIDAVAIVVVGYAYCWASSVILLVCMLLAEDQGSGVP